MSHPGVPLAFISIRIDQSSLHSRKVNWQIATKRYRSMPTRGVELWEGIGGDPLKCHLKKESIWQFPVTELRRENLA